jgi:IS30 family transposase
LPDINSSELGHFQADSIIGKATDKKAIASLIELNTGLV